MAEILHGLSQLSVEPSRPLDPPDEADSPENATKADGTPDPYFVMKEKDIIYEFYRSEHQLPEMTALIESDLSEPYSVYTYRYFLMQWPHLCFLVGIKQLLGSCNAELHWMRPRIA